MVDRHATITFCQIIQTSISAGIFIPFPLISYSYVVYMPPRTKWQMKLSVSTITLLNVPRQSNFEWETAQTNKSILLFFFVGSVFIASSSISVCVQIFINYHRVQLCLGWTICGRHCCDTYYICSYSVVVGLSCFIWVQFIFRKAIWLFCV